MKRLASVASTCGLAVSMIACSAPAPTPEPTATGRDEIVGGYLDEGTTGVVGLAIGVGGLFFQGHCSGTLIAPNLVLTARHCVALTSGGGPQGSVICGETQFTMQGPGSFFYASPAAVRPSSPNDPAFYRGKEVRVAPGADDICGFDMALIILEGAGMPSSAATPVVPRIDSTPEPGETYSALGYGIETPDGSGGGRRMRLDGNTVSCVGTACGAGIRHTEWVGDSRTCPGDSGGPAIDGEGRVEGVLSRGPQGCLSSAYGDLGSWGPWVMETALDAAEMGGYDPPFWATTGMSIPPDVTGEPCTDSCIGRFLCYEGTCQPPCDPAADDCPVDYFCSQEVGVCVEEPDPLGEPCDRACGKGFLCFSESGEPPGICIPPCEDGGEACPDGYECNADLGACTPRAGTSGGDGGSGDDGGCSCSVPGPDPSKPFPWVVSALGLPALLLRRARRRGGRP